MNEMIINEASFLVLSALRLGICDLWFCWALEWLLGYNLGQPCLPWAQVSRGWLHSVRRSIVSWNGAGSPSSTYRDLEYHFPCTYTLYGGIIMSVVGGSIQSWNLSYQARIFRVCIHQSQGCLPNEKCLGSAITNYWLMHWCRAHHLGYWCCLDATFELWELWSEFV